MHISNLQKFGYIEFRNNLTLCRLDFCPFVDFARIVVPSHFPHINGKMIHKTSPSVNYMLECSKKKRF